ncbi:MAG: hypothetical protein NT141_02975 [candidate division WWE3 bacterium]|nr:hypothetical protein [candidate division WWE3 bacterium]
MDTFESRDLMLSAAILSEGLPLLRTKDLGSHLIFVFGMPAACKKIEEAWWAGTLTINASMYAEAIKRLKNLVHSRSIPGKEVR